MKFQSYETKVITPQDYLTESVNRHRSASMTALRDKLNLRDKDVNLAWDPSAHPGHKVRL